MTKQEISDMYLTAEKIIISICKLYQQNKCEGCPVMFCVNNLNKIVNSKNEGK